MLAFVFPGQGSQAIGMGKTLYDTFAEARHVFQEVNDALHQNLSHLMFEGPADDLGLTENAQPAIMAVSMAAMAVARQQLGLNVQGHLLAGHSLGEYAAYATAGSFSLGDTARLLKIRGQAMQNAVPRGEGKMAALLGPGGAEAAQRLCSTISRDGYIVELANDNGPEQVVISGHRAAVDEAIAKATDAGFKRALPLDVSAPFHCSLMQSAAQAMDDALAAIHILTPQCLVMSNVSATPVQIIEDIRPLLVQQVTHMVRWREIVEYIKKQGIQKVIECGHGKVLSGLIKRIDPAIETYQLQNPEDLEKIAEII